MNRFGFLSMLYRRKTTVLTVNKASELWLMKKKMISNLMFKFALIVRCNYSVPIGKILMLNFFLCSWIYYFALKCMFSDLCCVVHSVNFFLLVKSIQSIKMVLQRNSDQKRQHPTFVKCYSLFWHAVSISFCLSFDS